MINFSYKISRLISNTNFVFKFFGTTKSKIQSLKKQNQIFNLTPRIIELAQTKLFSIKNHPLTIMKQKIINSLGSKFNCFDDFDPIVSTHNNFDVLNFPVDHCSKSPSDTFYINNTTLLRTHTSAHQKDILVTGLKDFVVFGDVYRRDQIDRFHYPVFHQMEAVSMLGSKDNISVDTVVKDMKEKIQKIIFDLFGKVQMRWIDAYFPFTYPSFQVQIFYQGKWVQMLGCGVIHQYVLSQSNRQKQIGWAAGLGLQRFAMKLFKIPDVRLFWSKDKRFIDQFKIGQISQFKQFSKYPICSKDFSMWIQPNFNPNDLFEIVRQIGGDLVQSVDQIDSYVDKKSNRTSKAYRINFRSLQRTLTNEQIIKMQFQIRKQIEEKLKTVKLR